MEGIEYVIIIAVGAALLWFAGYQVGLRSRRRKEEPPTPHWFDT
jgi:hypothetical protein